jgi:hypothetical protein
VLDKDLRELRSHVLHGLNLSLDSVQLMDCLTTSFACAEVVLGVPLIVDAMAGRREGRRVLADAEKARNIAQADPLRRVVASAAYTANTRCGMLGASREVLMAIYVCVEMEITNRPARTVRGRSQRHYCEARRTLSRASWSDQAHRRWAGTEDHCDR